jgi:hypothetical protein
MDFREVYFNEYSKSRNSATDSALNKKINDGNKPWHFNTAGTYFNIIPKDILRCIFEYYPGTFFYRKQNVTLDYCLNCGFNNKIITLCDGFWSQYSIQELSRLDKDFPMGDESLFMLCYRCKRAYVMKREKDTQCMFRPIIIKQLIHEHYGLDTRNINQYFLDISDKKWTQLQRFHTMPCGDLIIVIDCYYLTYRLTFIHNHTRNTGLSFNI